MSQDVAARVQAAKLPTIAINDTFRLAPDASILYAADARWWAHNARILRRWKGLKATAHNSVTDRSIHILRPTGVSGFDPVPGHVRTGGNSGYQAIHLAAQCGAKRIVLFGFDMHNRHGSHWHGQHQPPFNNPTRVIFGLWIQRFATLVEPLRARSILVVNATPGSDLRCWPIADPADILSSI